MNDKILAFGLLCLVGLNGPALAQQCPPGIAHGTPGCIPPNNPSSPLYPNSGSQPVVPPMVWADRWGAIAIDFSIGKIGTSTGMSSKRKAKKAALAQCRANGGVACKSSLTYFNQCGVMAWGESYAATAHAATIELASEIALRSCGEHTADCQIYYADCSMAERIQ